MRNAYFYGELEEEFYMDQPEGYVVPGKEHLVCRLKKSLYGLKQSARAWNQKTNAILQELGFVRGAADQCLYSRKTAGGSTDYVLR